MKIFPSLLLTSFLLVGCAQTERPATVAVVSQRGTKIKVQTVPQKKAVSQQAPVKTFRVRTTAYIGTKNAIGKPLSHGPVISAASDWSEFPLGTRFRVRQTGKTYVIDDYGSALVGTRTIDLCKPRASVMNAWGVKWVDIDILEWGSSRRSLEVLAPRMKVRHVRPMVAALRSQTGGIPGEFHRIESKP
jgi:3D (Asp-Asp-Asp) domain-containing protein